MHDLDLKSLRLFVAACEQRNLARAAAAEHIEPSAISKRIAQLEARLGAPLLVRDRRGVQPTPAGQALLEHARGMLFAAERIARDVAALAGGVRGHVRLLASASAMAESLLDDVASFMRAPENANIRVELEERLSTGVVRGVRDGEAPLGVCWDSADTRGLEVRAYRADHLALAVHPGHPLAAREALAFARTLDHEHVGLPPATAVHAMLQRAAAGLGRALSYRVIVSSFDAAFRVVAADLGVSVVPLQIAVTYARVLNVRAVPLTDAWARRRFVLVHRDDVALQPAALRLAEHLAACAARHDGPAPAAGAQASV